MTHANVNTAPYRKENQVKEAAKKKAAEEKAVKRVTAAPASLFFQHNTALGPPYRILVDTNFINFSLQNKIELVQGMMDCLYAKCACAEAVFTGASRS